MKSAAVRVEKMKTAFTKFVEDAKDGTWMEKIYFMLAVGYKK